MHCDKTSLVMRLDAKAKVLHTERLEDVLSAVFAQGLSCDAMQQLARNVNPDSIVPVSARLEEERGLEALGAPTWRSRRGQPR